MNRNDNRGDIGSSRTDGEKTRSVGHEWGGSDHPSTVVVRTVAAATERDVTDLPPLQESVDSDALNALVSRGDNRSGLGVRVSFGYAGTDVYLDAEGNVTVTPRTNGE